MITTPMTRVMVVTGASRNLGAAVAPLAAMRGYAVCVNYEHDEERAESGRAVRLHDRLVGPYRPIPVGRIGTSQVSPHDLSAQLLRELYLFA
jgi:NAD(P)-dependent dehydrogenase (short-subunit alcohol dehydrogenase family)